MITVGNEYSRKLGMNRQFVTITKILDDGTVEAVSKSGKQRFHTKIETVNNKWTLVKQANGETVTRTAPERVNTAVKTGTGKRLNNRPFVEVLIETICSSNVPMNAKQLVEKIKADGTYKFRDGVKTPWNSASTRLNTYMKEAGDNSKIKFASRGMFIKKD